MQEHFRNNRTDNNNSSSTESRLTWQLPDNNDTLVLCTLYEVLWTFYTDTPH